MANIGRVLREQLVLVLDQYRRRMPLLIAAALIQFGDLIEAEIDQAIDERIALHEAQKHTQDS